MKTSLEWLNQFLPGTITATIAAEALTHGGLPVEVITTVGPDTVIDVEVTSNRSDCLSVVGVGSRAGGPAESRICRCKTTDHLIDTGTASDTGLTAVGIDAPDLCPHYTRA